MAQEHIVKRLLNRRNLVDDLLYVEDEDEIYIWRDGVYQHLKRGNPLESLLTEALMNEKNHAFFGTPDALYPDEKPLNTFFSITPAFIDSVIRQIPVLMPQDRKTPTVSNSFITFDDGITVDFADPALTRHKASRAIPSFFKVPFPSTILDGEFDPATACPRWHQFLREVLVTDKDPDPDTNQYTPDQTLIDFLQEIMGYTLFSSIPNQSAVFLTGEGANGKSVILHIIKNMFPNGATSSVRLSDIAKSNFQLAAIVGKKVNIVHEEESKEMRVDVLKNIITGEPMTIERKYRSAVEITPTAKFLWGSNEIPTFDKLDEAIKRRIYIIPLRRVFSLEEQDVKLVDKLKAEAGPILRFAIEGARRIQRNNLKLTVPPSITATFNEVAEERYPAIRFFKQHYDVTGDPEDKITNKQMYESYKAWCKENGHKNQLTEQNFGRQVYSVDKRIKGGETIRITINGKRHYAKCGIRAKLDVPVPDSVSDFSQATKDPILPSEFISAFNPGVTRSDVKPNPLI